MASSVKNLEVIVELSASQKKKKFIQVINILPTSCYVLQRLWVNQRNSSYCSNAKLP